nr:hypothetical protein [bacterium]
MMKRNLLLTLSGVLLVMLGVARLVWFCLGLGVAGGAAAQTRAALHHPALMAQLVEALVLLLAGILGLTMKNRWPVIVACLAALIVPVVAMLRHGPAWTEGLMALLGLLALVGAASSRRWQVAAPALPRTVADSPTVMRVDPVSGDIPTMPREPLPIQPQPGPEQPDPTQSSAPQVDGPQSTGPVQEERPV